MMQQLNKFVTQNKMILFFSCKLTLSTIQFILIYLAWRLCQKYIHRMLDTDWLFVLILPNSHFSLRIIPEEHYLSQKL